MPWRVTVSLFMMMVMMMLTMMKQKMMTMLTIMMQRGMMMIIIIITSPQPDQRDALQSLDEWRHRRWAISPSSPRYWAMILSQFYQQWWYFGNFWIATSPSSPKWWGYLKGQHYHKVSINLGQRLKCLISRCKDSQGALACQVGGIWLNIHVVLLKH